MEFIDGPSLEDRLRQGGPLEVEEIVRVGLQTAAGLAAAHDQGLVHRDIKPANILLENGTRRVKITDFGLARAVDDASLTQSGFIVGTPAYMSPEQANGDPVDHRSDLFSLGSLLYQLCTGRPPFHAASTRGGAQTGPRRHPPPAARGQRRRAGVAGSAHLPAARQGPGRPLSVGRGSGRRPWPTPGATATAGFGRAATPAATGWRKPGQALPSRGPRSAVSAGRRRCRLPDFPRPHR